MKVSEKKINGILVLDVFDGHGTHLFRMAPEYGAKILELHFVGGSKRIPVLWKVLFDEMEGNTLGKNDILFPFPNRMAGGSFVYQGRPYAFPLNEPELKNSIHGFMREKSFSIRDKCVQENYVTIHLTHSYKGEPFYPFPCIFNIIYLISRDSFQMTFEITNIGKNAFPFGLGWHPYFILGKTGQGRLHVPGLLEYIVNERYLPTGATKKYEKDYFIPTNEFYNATFQLLKGEPKYLLDTQYGRLEITASSAFNFLQLYSPSGRKVIAIEPMTCCIDSFNNGIGLLELCPNETFTSKIGIRACLI